MYQPDKLKARRKELKMTQKDIADQLGISYQACMGTWDKRTIQRESKTTRTNTQSTKRLLYRN
jgi:repressor LexA